MRFQTRLLALALTAILAPLAACSSSPASSTDASDERKARIIANLTHEYPQISAAAVRIDSLGPSAVKGLDSGVFSVDGSPGQPFLVTTDNRQLYLLATDPIDVSRTDEQLAEATAARAAAAATEVGERAQALKEATATLPSRGPANAKVTIVEFSDFQCSFCKLATETVKTLMARYPQDVRLVYAHFPLPNHPWAEPAAVAATCAAQQNADAFWSLHDTYFADQRAFTPENVLARSKPVVANSSMDAAAWEDCASNEQSAQYQMALAAVKNQTALGEQLGVTGTPGFFVNGRFINGNQPIPVFVEAIDAALADG